MRKCILRKTPGKFSGSLPQRYVGAGRQKLFQPEFTQNFNGGIPRTLGFYVAANIGNIDVIAFAGTFTQCFRNICIAKAFLFKNQLNGAVHLFVKRVDHGSIHEMILAQKFAEALNARDGFAHSFNGHTAAVTPAA